MQAIIRIIAIYLGCMLLSRESLSQVIFPDGGYTTQSSIATIATNNQNYYGNNQYVTYIQTNVCYCVNNRRCSSANGGNPTDGSGIIDIRIVNTGSGSSTGSVTSVTTVSSGINPIIVSQSYCQSNLELCCPSTGYSCGISYSPYSAARPPTGNQAYFGSYPWQAIILTTANVYVGSGALIDHMHVLTVAHKVNSYLNNGIQLKVRMGDWDVSGATYEPIPSQEFNVTRIFIHPQYSSSSLSNSIAILRLTPNVPLGQVPTITTACLTASIVANMRCWVAGWGSSSFVSGSSQSIQTQVEVPLVDQATCQSKLRATKLGSNFILDTFSFMCAGGEAGKDACTGDGGSPLVCPIGGKWYVVGLVAWGIGCGSTDVPGVYINVTNYINWIQTTTRY